MKVKMFFSLFLLFFSLFLYPNAAKAQEVVQGELLLRFKSNIPPDVRNQTLQAATLSIPTSLRPEIRITATKELSKLDVITVYIPEYAKGMFIAFLARDKNVEFIEPNFKAKKTANTNDPSLKDQWGVYKVLAANDSGESAWDITQAINVKVAVLDTGIFKDHIDLSGKVVLDKNFSNSFSTADVDGHGTHVAGTICATTNNGVGVAGVGYNCELLNGKVLDDSGYGTYSGISSGIIWAADNGAKVINLSLGGTADSATLKNAVEYAASKGSVVVAAAGNEYSSSKIYPAAYPTVLSVGAVDQNDQKPSWSNYGTWVDVAAPGVSILSSYKNGGYVSYSGTSMATSIVSGVAALEWGSGNCLTATCVIDTIQTTADAISGTGTNWVWGRVNAYSAVKKQSTITPSTSPTPTLTPTPTMTPTLTQTPTPTYTPTPTPTGSQAPTATPTPSNSPTQIPTNTTTPTQTPTPTPTQTQQIMTVSAIDISYSKLFTLRTISVKPSVINQASSAPISSARVTVKLTTPSGRINTGSATTGNNGVATVSFWFLTETGQYKATIDSVIKTGYSYSATTSSKVFIVE